MPAHDRESFAFEVQCTSLACCTHTCNTCTSHRSTMEMERFELLTPCLQGRCSPNWATPPYNSGSHLLSHIVSNIVSSAAQVLTIVFGMRTGVSPERIATGKFWALSEVLSSLVRKLFFAACCNRTSSVSVSWLFSFRKEVRFTKFDLRFRLISLSSFELSSH